jgi:GntR family transcriptional regulator of vanillate catabolism
MTTASRSNQHIKALLQLREALLSGAFAPGERITERVAVDRLAISRTPVRSALNALEHEGFLTAMASGGYMVRSFSLADLNDSIDLRGLLEGMAARRAAERRPTPDELAPIQETVAEMEPVVAAASAGREVFDRYVELNARFHSQLLELAASPMLARSLAHVESLPFASPNAFIQLQANASDRNEILLISQTQHRAIVEAIALGEGTRAEHLAREHARLARRNLAAAQERLDLMRQVPGAALMGEPEPKRRRRRRAVAA